MLIEHENPCLANAVQVSISIKAPIQDTGSRFGVCCARILLESSRLTTIHTNSLATTRRPGDSTAGIRTPDGSFQLMSAGVSRSERSEFVHISRIPKAGPGVRNVDPSDAINSETPLNKLAGAIYAL